jgi:hypothetical protein
MLILLLGNPKERDELEVIGHHEGGGGWTIEMYFGIVWNGFLWLRKDNCDWLLLNNNEPYDRKAG